MDTRLDSFSVQSVSGTSTMRVVLLDANGDFISQTSTFNVTTTKTSLRELIAGGSQPFTLPEGAAACYYKIVTGAVYLGRDALYPYLSTNRFKGAGQTLDSTSETLYAGEEGFLGKVRAW